MKRILSLLSTVAAIFAFTACEDVPEPYVLNTTGTTNTLLNETFASSLGKFNSKSASGSLQWKNDYSSAVITGFQDFDGDGDKENQAGETYLVSPAVHLEDVDSAFVSFSQAINYEKQTINEDHKLLISSDYTNDVTTATWTEIPISFNGVGGSFTFVDQEVQIPESFMGKTVYLALKHIAHDSYSSTWEVKNFKVQRGVAGEQKPEEPSIIEGEATGTGTLEDPFNCVAALNYINSLGSGVESTENVYIKGKVVSIKEQYGTQYGNATFYISDDGTEINQFYVFRALYLNNTKYKEGTLLSEGDDVVICGKVINYQGNTPETVTGKAYLYSLNDEVSEGTTEPTGEAKGTGTLEDPYNSIAAIKYINTLGNDVESPNDIYIKGKVVSIVEQYGTQYGNATFYISDDGTEANQFQIYRALYLGNKKYTSGTQIKEGDEVIVCGKVVLFRGNTPETVTGKAYLYSLNGDTGNGDTPTPPGEAKGSGTLADPYNSVAVTNFINTLGSDVESSNDVYIKGKVVSIVEQYGTQYGNATFYISDDGTANNQFQVYRALYLGNKKYTSGTQLKEGDEVIVCGKVVNFRGNTPETVTGKAYLYSLNGETTPSENPNTDNTGEDNNDNTQTVAGNAITFSSMEYDNAQDFNDIKINVGDATIVFSKGNGSTTPKYYNAGTSMRMYGGNTLTISSDKTIKNISIKYGDDYNGSSYYPTADNSTVSAGTYNYESHIWSLNSTSGVLTRNAQPGHFRIVSITIEY